MTRSLSMKPKENKQRLEFSDSDPDSNKVTLAHYTLKDPRQRSEYEKHLELETADAKEDDDDEDSADLINLKLEKSFDDFILRLKKHVFVNRIQLPPVLHLIVEEDKKREPQFQDEYVDKIKRNFDLLKIAIIVCKPSDRFDEVVSKNIHGFIILTNQALKKTLTWQNMIRYVKSAAKVTPILIFDTSDSTINRALIDINKNQTNYVVKVESLHNGFYQILAHIVTETILTFSDSRKHKHYQQEHKRLFDRFGQVASGDYYEKKEANTLQDDDIILPEQQKKYLEEIVEPIKNTAMELALAHLDNSIYRETKIVIVSEDAEPQLRSWCSKIIDILQANDITVVNKINEAELIIIITADENYHHSDDPKFYRYIDTDKDFLPVYLDLSDQMEKIDNIFICIIKILFAIDDEKDSRRQLGKALDIFSSNIRCVSPQEENEKYDEHNVKQTRHIILQQRLNEKSKSSPVILEGKAYVLTSMAFSYVNKDLGWPFEYQFDCKPAQIQELWKRLTIQESASDRRELSEQDFFTLLQGVIDEQKKLELVRIAKDSMFPQKHMLDQLVEPMLKEINAKLTKYESESINPQVPACELFENYFQRVLSKDFLILFINSSLSQANIVLKSGERIKRFDVAEATLNFVKKSDLSSFVLNLVFPKHAAKLLLCEQLDRLLSIAKNVSHNIREYFEQPLTKIGAAAMVALVQHGLKRINYYMAITNLQPIEEGLTLEQLIITGLMQGSLAFSNHKIPHSEFKEINPDDVFDRCYVRAFERDENTQQVIAESIFAPIWTADKKQEISPLNLGWVRIPMDYMDLDEKKYTPIRWQRIKETTDDGDCGLHAIFNDDTKAKYTCADVKTKRAEIAAKIKTIPKGHPQARKLIMKIFKLFVADGHAIGPVTKNLIQATRQGSSRASVEQTLWSKMLVELQSYPDIIQELKTSSPISFAVMKEIYQQDNAVLPALIRSVPSLQLLWQKCLDHVLYDISFEEHYDGFLQEYADFMSKPRTWLSLEDIHLLALLYDFTLIFFNNAPSDKNKTIIYNPGRAVFHVICYQHAQRHFERWEPQSLDWQYVKQSEPVKIIQKTSMENTKFTDTESEKDRRIQQLTQQITDAQKLVEEYKTKQHIEHPKKFELKWSEQSEQKLANNSSMFVPDRREDTSIQLTRLAPPADFFTRLVKVNDFSKDDYKPLYDWFIAHHLDEELKLTTKNWFKDDLIKLGIIFAKLFNIHCQVVQKEEEIAKSLHQGVHVVAHWGKLVNDEKHKSEWLLYGVDQRGQTIKKPLAQWFLDDKFVTFINRFKHIKKFFCREVYSYRLSQYIMAYLGIGLAQMLNLPKNQRITSELLSVSIRKTIDYLKFYDQLLARTLVPLQIVLADPAAQPNLSDLQQWWQKLMALNSSQVYADLTLNNSKSVYQGECPNSIITLLRDLQAKRFISCKQLFVPDHGNFKYVICVSILNFQALNKHTHQLGTVEKVNRTFEEFLDKEWHEVELPQPLPSSSSNVSKAGSDELIIKSDAKLLKFCNFLRWYLTERFQVTRLSPYVQTKSPYQGKKTSYKDIFTRLIIGGTKMAPLPYAEVVSDILTQITEKLESKKGEAQVKFLKDAFLAFQDDIDDFYKSLALRITINYMQRLVRVRDSDIEILALAAVTRILNYMTIPHQINFGFGTTKAEAFSKLEHLFLEGLASMKFRDGFLQLFNEKLATEGTKVNWSINGFFIEPPIEVFGLDSTKAPTLYILDLLSYDHYTPRIGTLQECQQKKLKPFGVNLEKLPDLSRQQRSRHLIQATSSQPPSLISTTTAQLLLSDNKEVKNSLATVKAPPPSLPILAPPTKVSQAGLFRRLEKTAKSQPDKNQQGKNDDYTVYTVSEFTLRTKDAIASNTAIILTDSNQVYYCIHGEFLKRNKEEYFYTTIDRQGIAKASAGKRPVLAQPSPMVQQIIQAALAAKDTLITAPGASTDLVMLS